MTVYPLRSDGTVEWPADGSVPFRRTEWTVGNDVEFRSRAKGPHFVIVHGAGRTAARYVEFAPDSRETIDLEGSEVHDVRVQMVAPDGSAVRGVTATILGHDVLQFPDAFAEDTVVRGVVGDPTILVSAPGFGAVALPTRVLATDHSVEARLIAELTTRVRDVTGAPLPGIRVFAYSRPEHGVTFADECVTDASGRARFAGTATLVHVRVGDTEESCELIGGSERLLELFVD